MSAAHEARARALYEDFREEEAEYLDTVPLPVYDVGLVIGQCLGVLYETSHDGERVRYIHKFKAKSRPLLVSSDDGKQLYLLGGAYTFTERGIVDD